MGAPVVIIGTGLAGYAVARELRKRDAQVPVLMISADSGDFYPKPALSNALAQGRSAAQLVTTSHAGMAKQLGIEVHVHLQVTGIDSVNKLVLTSNGGQPYSQLVLAVGAEPIRLPIAGDGAAQVLSVNDLDGYARMRELLGAPPQRVLLIGAGLIGCEFADDLAGAGHRVAVVDPSDGPMAALLPPPASEALRAALAARGVEFHFGDVVQQIDAKAGAYTVSLRSGHQIEVDLVMSAVGLRARTSLAVSAGLSVNRGILVDSHLRTRDPAILALGDCAEIDGHWRPYVMPILPAARALAATLTGQSEPVVFGPMPVLVKTPSLPVVVLPIERNAAGRWQSEPGDGGLKLVFTDAQGRLTGFVLTGSRTAERGQLVKQMSAGGA